eukprot:CAMPEP_0206276778 /NCGR_PEP_ID=MMETSP0047_2-20121206/36488_1 /ASSEMBLY_ACC=CAM_ASM_000192 /TAXON_ID=195065 /ORGANISM="Chroomonas mesostigmatica_cf, Strain CCMP1168" /LENGTH=312 /DNA_ID=CAMNT_0053706319 /DNA_START=245 /DNA_END=1184 /DNA_ORIENTATION=+
MFGGGLSKQIGDVLLQIQQLRSDLLQSLSHHAEKHVAAQHGGHGHPHIDVHRLSLQHDTIPVFHLIVDLFNILGVLVIVVCTLGILPTLVYHIFPLAFNLTDTRKLHGKMLECRLQLSRGLILGMDLMVASDVVETLCGQVDLVKLVVIVAVRSWLGYERNHEMAHMTHEYDEIRKKTSSALKSHMGDVTKENLIEKINETFETLDNDKNGRIDASELKRAFDMVGAKASDKEVAGVLAHPRGMNRLEFAKLLRSMSFIKSLGTEKELDKIVEEIGEQGHVGAGADATTEQPRRRCRNRRRHSRAPSLLNTE